MATLSRLVFTYLLNALWQVSLVTAAAVSAAYFAKRVPARYRHALWVMGLVLAVLLPLRTLPDAWRLACRSSQATAETPMEAATLPPRSSDSGGLPAVLGAQHMQTSSPGTWAAIAERAQNLFAPLDPIRHHHRSIPLPPLFAYAAFGLYLFSVLCQCARLARAWAGARRLRSHSQARELPPQMARLVAQCQTALGLGRVSIRASSHVGGPATLGFRDPVIILPEALFLDSPADQLTSALCHEMAHVRRRDYLLNLIYEFLFLPIAFHPGAWLLRRRMNETRELACDEAAAGRLLSPTAYARSLVSLAQSLAPLAPALNPRYTLGVFDANVLEERIMRLLDQRPQISARRAKLLVSGAALALALAALAAGAFSLTAVGTTKAMSAPGPQTDFSGRWELDRSASDLPSPAPDNLVEVIEQHGSDLKVTTTSKDWNTNKPIAVSLFALMLPEFLAMTDGKENVQPFGPGLVRSKTHWEDNKLVTDWTLERNGQVAVTGRWVRSLATDGNTQTIQITAHDPVRNLDGEAKAVFVRREEAPRAFLGVWHGEFQGTPFVTLNLKSEGNRVTGTMSDFDVRIDTSGNILEATPGSGGGWEIVEARFYDGTLHMKCQEGDQGEIDAFGLKLLDGDRAELEIVQPPGNPAPRPLVLRRESANNQGANQGGEEDRRAFFGTWRGQFNGKTYIIVSLKEADGVLAGGVSVGGFRIDGSGQVVRVNEEAKPSESTPVSDAKVVRDLLSFNGRTPDGGSVVHFQMRLTGQNAAELLCLILDPRAGTPAPGWWKLFRQSEDSRTAGRGAGPVGGIEGGIRGGIAGNVAGGGVRGGVSGGVTGGVTGGVGGGVPGGVAGGI